MTDESPHSKACGHAQHDHGVDCSPNCPTCHGVPKPIGVRPETGVEVNSTLAAGEDPLEMAPSKMWWSPSPEMVHSSVLLNDALDTLTRAKELPAGGSEMIARNRQALAIQAAAQISLADTLRGVESDAHDDYANALEQFRADVEAAVKNWTLGRPDGLTEFTTFYNHISRLVAGVENNVNS